MDERGAAMRLARAKVPGRAARRRGPLRERLALQAIELGLRDRAAVEQALGLLDLGRRTARRLANVVVEALLRALHLLNVARRHVVAVREHVGQEAQERKDQERDQPQRLLASRRVLAPEHVHDDLEQHHEIDDHEEDDQERPEKLAKTQYNHVSSFLPLAVADTMSGGGRRRSYPLRRPPASGGG